MYCARNYINISANIFVKYRWFRCVKCPKIRTFCVLCSKCEFDAVKNSSLWNVSKTSSQRNWSLILHDYNNLLMIYSGNRRLYFSKETFSPNSCNTDEHHFFKRAIFLRSNEIFVKNSVVQKVTMDNQNGLFREIKKIVFLKTNEKTI